MSLIKESAGDYRPTEWSVLDYMLKHERALNKLRLQTAFGALNRQRGALRAAIAAYDRGQEDTLSPEEELQRVYLRDAMVGAYYNTEAALCGLAEASGGSFAVERQPLPRERGAAEVPESLTLPF